MKTMTQRLSTVAVLAVVAGSLFAPAASAAQPDGPANGGDRGYGNCGFNNSGKPGEKGTPPGGDNSPGLGGFVGPRGEKPAVGSCGVTVVVTPPSLPDFAVGGPGGF